MRIVDLSAPISSSPAGTPEFQRTTVEYLDHRSGAEEVELLYGVGPELLRDGEGWTRETLTLGTHNSTHVDAPYHYNSKIQGEPAQTIDDLPLEWFYAPGVVLDVTGRADGEAVDVSCLEQSLDACEHSLSEGDIVLLNSGRDIFYGRSDYIERGPGVTAAATKWLFARGIRVMGIDAWGWDRPLSTQAADARSRQESGIFWEAHQVDLPYCQIERLVNLAEIPATGFKVACFPLRVEGASAAPARVVAMIDEG